MRFPWPFHNHRQDIIAEAFPDAWTAILDTNVRHFALLTEREKARLKDDLRIFMAEKSWEGAQGLEINDEIKVTVSALACLLTIGFEKPEYFPNVETIIVYPAGYVAESSERAGASVIMGGSQGRLGEAHGHGPVVLSWADVLSGGQNETDGHNLVFHEFAHKLDFRDGDANGVPYLRDQAEIDDWDRVMSAAFDQLVEDVQHGRHSILRAYGATDPAEFFAVCTESYFDQSVHLKTHMPELYNVLKDYYGIDWAERVEGWSATE